MDDSDDEFVPDDDVPMRQAKPRPAPKKKPAAATKKKGKKDLPKLTLGRITKIGGSAPPPVPPPKPRGERARRQSRTAASPRDPQGDLPPLRHHRKHEQALLQRMYTFRGPPPFDR